MPIPNGGLITETNQQYYEGAQGFQSPVGAIQPFTFTTTFNTDLTFGNWDITSDGYFYNNFKLYTSATGLANSYVEFITEFSVAGNTITIPLLAPSTFVVVQLKSLSGGRYGDEDAYGIAVNENYDSYSYTRLDDIVNNFLVAYVGQDKLIPNVKRTDVIFHAKRGLQEFSYDTLRSIRSQELNVPPSLSVIIPQDYVNYTAVSWIDQLGVKRPIYPANNLTTNPYEVPLQDDQGMPLQDNIGDNLEGTSITNERWDAANVIFINGAWSLVDFNQGLDLWGYSQGGGPFNFNGQQYGLDGKYSQVNGWFTIDDREGKMSFSSNLSGSLIVLEYISDGLAYDLDTRVPKMAEEALYAHISHAIIASRINQPEYIVQRLRRERSSKLRNAKIRLSNVKLNEIVQAMRGQSKWIKH
tara:strand:- start:2472 stop:3710 length:1239 start_codon:yes stop_codon:yes gene_type:complete